MRGGISGALGRWSPGGGAGVGESGGSAGGAELVLGLIGGQAEPRGFESTWSQGGIDKTWGWR